MKIKPLALLLGVCCILLLGVQSTAAEVDCDSRLRFTAQDFSEQPLEGICITALGQHGTLWLGQRVVRSGDILTAGQLEELTFQPLQSQYDAQQTVTYLPIFENRVAPAATLTISIRGKKDHPPVAEDSTLETYKNLPNTGSLKAYDPEGRALTYTLVRSPRRGQVAINEDGTFTYTPRKNKVGTDSFTYTVTDPAGNVSRQATVTVEILKPCDKQRYADTEGSSCRFSAEWLRSTGVFTGENVGGQLCFRPQEQVTRGQFLAMLVDTLNIPTAADALYTGFTDESPAWLRPYLAAALRSGLTAGWGSTVFGAETAISAEEAALLLQNALALPTAAAEEQDILLILAENGITLPQTDALNREQAANALYALSRLSATAPGLGVIARQ